MKQTSGIARPRESDAGAPRHGRDDVYPITAAPAPPLARGAAALYTSRSGDVPEESVPNIRWLLRLVTVVHRFLYQLAGGRFVDSIGGVRILLLTTRGRRTGRERVTPLLFVEDDDRFVVVASNAGDDRAPAWWLNLRADPGARVQAGRDRFRVTARPASAEEAEHLWPRLEASYPAYASYRERTSREIPVVILEPVPAESA